MSVLNSQLREGQFRRSAVLRRDFLKSLACGFGYTAFLGLQARGSEWVSPPHPHFSPKAKRVLFLFMQGGPSHVDTFDYKPELIEMGGKTGQGGRLLSPISQFSPRGQSGLMISDLYPYVSAHADDLCLLNGMHTDNAAHPQASIAMHTGSVNFVRPSMGSWILYGLGSENQDLPGFVTINPSGNVGGAQNYGAAFLPASYQGTPLYDVNRMLPNIQNQSLGLEEQRRHLDWVQRMNRDASKRVGGESKIEGLIQSYELAFRMQSAVPSVMDLKEEPDETRHLYGLNRSETEKFGTQCLMARRFLEKGVRFVQVTHGGWDQHNNLRKRLEVNARETDQPIAGLLTDLKRRGLLDETLVLWGGEFGRSPEAQTDAADGRRHNNRGFTMWMAGGGVAGGKRYGATDPLGRQAVEGRVHIHDWHATILYALGLDHERLTYRYSGRDFRLTDVAGQVVRGVFES